MSATQAQEQLSALLAQRFLRPARGIDGEVEAARAAYIGLAVTEIASLRAELGMRTEG